MTDDAETRLVRLEETVAHQGAAIEDLSRALSDQWKLIERLNREIALLGERFEAVEEGSDAPAASQKPPHW